MLYYPTLYHTMYSPPPQTGAPLSTNRVLAEGPPQFQFPMLSSPAALGCLFFYPFLFYFILFFIYFLPPHSPVDVLDFPVPSRLLVTGPPADGPDFLLSFSPTLRFDFILGFHTWSLLGSFRFWFFTTSYLTRTSPPSPIFLPFRHLPSCPTLPANLLQ